jgi:hypothetical protein
MRIAFSGTACTGKTTVVKAFLERWSDYKTPKTTYRDVIKNNRHSKKTDKKTQLAILDFMITQQKPYTPHDKVVYDRCPLDNIVYTLWAHDKGLKGFNENYINMSIEKVKESMRSLDIIFLITRDLMGPIESNLIRETDPQYVIEIDNIFKAIHKQIQTTGVSPFLPQHDSPALIEISGTTEERIEQIAMYVTPEGTMYGEEQSLVNMDEIAKMEQLIRDQKEFLKKDKGIL